MSAKPNIKKAVLAYSGGLDTSVILKWLQDEYQCEVVTFTADIGQGDELEGLEEKALNSGASKIFIEDLSDEFLRKREDYMPACRRQGSKAQVKGPASDL